MHTEYRCPAVYYLCSIVCYNIGDCTSATLIDFSKFSCLPYYIIVVKKSGYLVSKLCIRIIAATFSA